MLIIRFVIFFWVSTGTSLQALMLKNTAQRCSTVCPLLLRCSVLAPVSLRPLLNTQSAHTCLSQHWEKQQSRFVK